MSDEALWSHAEHAAGGGCEGRERSVSAAPCARGLCKASKTLLKTGRYQRPSGRSEEVDNNSCHAGGTQAAVGDTLAAWAGADGRGWHTCFHASQMCARMYLSVLKGTFHSLDWLKEGTPHCAPLATLFIYHQYACRICLVGCACGASPLWCSLGLSS